MFLGPPPHFENTRQGEFCGNNKNKLFSGLSHFYYVMTVISERCSRPSVSMGPTSVD